MSIKMHPFDNCNRREQESGSISITSILPVVPTAPVPLEKNDWVEEYKNKLASNEYDDLLLEIQDSKTYCNEVHTKLCGAIKSISSGIIIEKSRFWITLTNVTGKEYLDIDFAEKQIRFYKSWLGIENNIYERTVWYNFSEDLLREYLITVLGAK